MNRRSLVYTAIVVLFTAGFAALAFSWFTTDRLAEPANVTGDASPVPATQNRQPPRAPTITNVPPAGAPR